MGNFLSHDASSSTFAAWGKWIFLAWWQQKCWCMFFWALWWGTEIQCKLYFTCQYYSSPKIHLFFCFALLNAINQLMTSGLCVSENVNWALFFLSGFESFENIRELVLYSERMKEYKQMVDHFLGLITAQQSQPHIGPDIGIFPVGLQASRLLWQ